MDQCIYECDFSSIKKRATSVDVQALRRVRPLDILGVEENSSYFDQLVAQKLKALNLREEVKYEESKVEEESKYLLISVQFLKKGESKNNKGSLNTESNTMAASTTKSTKMVVNPQVVSYRDPVSIKKYNITDKNGNLLTKTVVNVGVTMPE